MPPRGNILSSVAYFSTASKGLLDAAHFCYLMAQVGFGVYTRKTTKLVLIGSNHRFGFLLSFFFFPKHDFLDAKTKAEWLQRLSWAVPLSLAMTGFGRAV